MGKKNLYIYIYRVYQKIRNLTFRLLSSFIANALCVFLYSYHSASYFLRVYLCSLSKYSLLMKYLPLFALIRQKKLEMLLLKIFQVFNTMLQLTIAERIFIVAKYFETRSIQEFLRLHEISFSFFINNLLVAFTYCMFAL